MAHNEETADYLALRSRPLFTGDDPRALHKAISDVTANKHRMLMDPAAGLRGEVHGLLLGRIGLVSIRYSTPLTVNSRATGRRVLAVIPRAPMEVASGGRRWVSDQPFVMGTHHGTELLPAPGKGALVAAVDAAELERSIEVATGRRLRGPLRLTAEQGPMLLAAPSMVRSAYWEACRGIELSGSAEFGRPMADSPLPGLLEQHLLSAIAIGVSPFLVDALADGDAAGPGYLAAAKEFVDQHLATDLTVGRIARACGISERQLHSAFRDHLAITPAQFIRERRLRAAHRLLTDPAFAMTGTVGQAAARVGVQHLGRFAGMYAERYDQPPSETLAQTRRSGHARLLGDLSA
ncbi:helix-turn-helix domain-containing protein [Granulicoccus sp. GXG6511]|uniref:helix-turn-helix transcriptional regulator n=1 Tax=Granulicoccus sp. GXG6511 TaxID=3381351 RepID=UPI003D7CB369